MQKILPLVIRGKQIKALEKNACFCACVDKGKTITLNMLCLDFITSNVIDNIKNLQQSKNSDSDFVHGEKYIKCTLDILDNFIEDIYWIDSKDIDYYSCVLDNTTIYPLKTFRNTHATKYCQSKVLLQC